MSRAEFRIAPSAAWIPLAVAAGAIAVGVWIRLRNARIRGLRVDLVLVSMVSLLGLGNRDRHRRHDRALPAHASPRSVRWILDFL